MASYIHSPKKSLKTFLVQYIQINIVNKMEPLSLLFLFIITFVSSIMGSMIGGAIFLILPAMIFLGLPVHNAIATTRFVMLGTGLGSTSNFYRHGRINFRLGIPFIFTAILGTIVGATLVPSFNEKFLKNTFAFLMIVVGILIYFQEKLGITERKLIATKKKFAISMAIGFVLGIFGGFFGGGMAILLIFTLVSFFGLSFIDAVANSKPILLSITLIATIIFFFKKLILFSVGVPLLVVSFAGAVIGSQIAVKIGNDWIKRLFLVIVIVTAIRLLFFN